jgi:hypothetical protein
VVIEILPDARRLSQNENRGNCRIAVEPDLTLYTEREGGQALERFSSLNLS